MKEKIRNICTDIIRKNENDDSIHFIDLTYYSHELSFLKFLNDCYYDIFNSTKEYKDFVFTDYEKLYVYYENRHDNDPIMLTDNKESTKEIINEYYNNVIEIIQELKI